MVSSISAFALTMAQFGSCEARKCDVFRYESPGWNENDLLSIYKPLAVVKFLSREEFAALAVLQQE
jgi:hypothetical protein